MKKLVFAGVAAAMVTGAASAEDTASENKRDMSKLTCGEFVEMSAPEAIMTLFWMDGYLTQDAENPVWDAETFVEHREKLVTICVADDGEDKLVLEEIRNLD